MQLSINTNTLSIFEFTQFCGNKTQENRGEFEIGSVFVHGLTQCTHIWIKSHPHLRVTQELGRGEIFSLILAMAGASEASDSAFVTVIRYSGYPIECVYSIV